MKEVSKVLDAPCVKFNESGRFKVAFMDKMFATNEGTTTCIVSGFLTAPDGCFVPGSVFRVAGFATCNESDTFDESIGRNLASSRAEIAAYNLVKSSILPRLRKRALMLANATEDLATNLSEYVDENKRFMERVESRIVEK